MSDIDKRLEELVEWGDSQVEMTSLAAALLRARRALRLIASEVEMLDYPGAAKEALTDTDLEELLR